jgi:translation initiation factor eIF-2B subunit delta
MCFKKSFVHKKERATRLFSLLFCLLFPFFLTTLSFFLVLSGSFFLLGFSQVWIDLLKAMTSYEEHLVAFAAVVDEEQERRKTGEGAGRTIMRRQRGERGGKTAAAEGSSAETRNGSDALPAPGAEVSGAAVAGGSAAAPSSSAAAGESKDDAKEKGTPRGSDSDGLSPRGTAAASPKTPEFVRQVGFEAAATTPSPEGTPPSDGFALNKRAAGKDDKASAGSGLGGAAAAETTTRARGRSAGSRSLAVDIPAPAEEGGDAQGKDLARSLEQVADELAKSASPTLSPAAALSAMQSARSNISGWSDKKAEKAEPAAPARTKKNAGENQSQNQQQQQQKQQQQADSESRQQPEKGQPSAHSAREQQKQQQRPAKGAQQQQKPKNNNNNQNQNQNQKQAGPKKNTNNNSKQAHQGQNNQKGKGKGQSQSDLPNASSSASSASSSSSSSAALLASSRPAEQKHQVWGMFSHLPPPKRAFDEDDKHLSAKNQLHPAILELGTKYANGMITGSTARAVALLYALQEVIYDFSTPEGVFLFRDLDIRPSISHVVKCRPMSVSMGVVVKHVKHYLAASKAQTTQAEAKTWVLGKMDKFLEERIVVADKAIADIGADRIVDGDVVLTFGRSNLVEAILKKAQARKKKFRVVVTDCAPRYEGKELLHRLAAHGMGACSYALIGSVSYVMKDATKVMVGAHTMTANGCLISRCGTAQVAAAAAHHRVPFLVACETYKFSERVQTESFSYNELGDPAGVVADVVAEEKLRLRNIKAQRAAEEAEGSFQRSQPGGAPNNKKTALAQQKQQLTSSGSGSQIGDLSSDAEARRRILLDAADGPHRHGENGLLILNLAFDLTPADFVAAVLTEHGMIPTTAVPVVLREFALEGLGI